jgi:hypothetical protein
MSRTKALRKEIASVGSEAAWRMMPLQELEDRFVTEMSQFPEERLAKVIQRLSSRDFEFWTKKLWDAQDIQPDPRDQMASYERSMSVMVVLKRSLLLRLAVEPDAAKRTQLNQQLGLLSLILNPAAVAEITGMPLVAGSSDEEEEDSS